jgi:hypothetical protein
MLVWEEDEDPFLGPALLDSFFSVSRGSDERRQSVEGQSFHVLDVLLPGLAINRLSTLLYKTIVQNHCFLTFLNNGGVCSIDLRLDTSTNGLKQVYTS